MTGFQKGGESNTTERTRNSGDRNILRFEKGKEKAISQTKENQKGNVF